MIEKNNLILNELKTILNNHFPNIVEKIILFGSRNNSNFQEYSDYDILIILNINYDWNLESEIIDLCYEIDLKYDIVTDIKIISSKELTEPRGRQTYIQEALLTGLQA